LPANGSSLNVLANKIDQDQFANTEKMFIPETYLRPIQLDNRDLRAINPYVAAHLDESRDELAGLPSDEGIIRDHKFVNWIDCPCCGNPDTKQWVVKWGGRYDQCPSCLHIFLKNSFRKEILRDLYKNSVANELDRKANRNLFNRQYWSLVYRKYLSLISDLLVRPAGGFSVLDIGCGAGYFLEVCREENIRVEGVDVYDGMIESLDHIVDQENLHQVEDILEFCPGKSYNVATMWGVLEHLPETSPVLNRCSELLVEGGLLIALIPNLKSRAVRYLGASVPTLNPCQHVNFYSHKSLEMVSGQSGFSVVGVLNELPVIDLMWPFIDQKDQAIIDDIVAHDESYYLVYILQKRHS
jgi:2-polyprenyl-3-methyl-5-hydroxy-6-metoxy-1,4-benzoquinol methylase